MKSISKPRLDGSKHSTNIRKTRQWILPDAIEGIASETLVGIPRRRFALLTRIFIALLLSSSAAAAFYILRLEANILVRSASVAVFLFFLITIGGAIYALRKGLIDPPLAYVSPSGVYVKDCTKPEAIAVIEWCKVVPNKKAIYDVALERTRTLKGLWMEWRFFERIGDQINERRVRKSLNLDSLRSAGLKNTWEINRAILANLIVHSQTPLTFDPMLFVHLQIDPISWKRMRLPGHVYRIATLSCILPITIWFLIFSPLDTSASTLFWEIMLVVFFIFLPWIALIVWMWSKLYPQYYGDGVIFQTGKQRVSDSESLGLLKTKPIQNT